MAQAPARNNVMFMMIASPRAVAAHRRNIDLLVSTGQDLARTVEKTREMTIASLQTIGYRTAMMMRAMGDPAAMSNPEFTLMSHEKVEAAVESQQAMLESCQALFEGWTAWFAHQAGTTTKTMTELAACRTPADALQVQQHFMQCTCVNAAHAMTKLTQATVRMTNAGLLPIHKVAAANAQRLAREHG
ncbi:hypothetical protein N825_34475 [Skermanella stibiiresistens SB22]|uniref:Phasin domain-containing protein n=2 Tax=Skermanella TaxID=204447 RepID=W9H7B1_9PROT|nr:hypothetical protein N825_34475 [Skermanella stibiiresistens SB22]